jgi:hypothetical protein
MKYYEILHCLLCGKQMDQTNRILYTDYYCTGDDSMGRHHFTMRIKDNTMAKLWVHFFDDELHLKVHYDEKYSQVWSSSKSERIKIDQIIIPDFMNIEKLKNKIKTILVFS